jgi:hypothetical protein
MANLQMGVSSMEDKSIEEKILADYRDLRFSYSLTADDFKDGDIHSGCSHWKVSISRDHQRFDFEYHMGCAYRHWKRSINDTPLQVSIGDPVRIPHRVSLWMEAYLIRDTEPNPPELVEVIYCLISMEFGYDTDSRKAEKSYLQCQDTLRNLRLLGMDIDALYDLFADY